ncbi:long-chain-fatty-acid--CoA ligase [Adhaeribacter radiodurans]|uniref:Long-chain fatty acid--CoA ligase n=1 Tax=Adhaeribacter radiodurans TaxID=2745197 RepID=A0A7L7LCQ9_9BACT|nr:long-chain fatty acid--CoA ligase [Adhaeribacter radiodurans]QMU30563.1 long-chain fatty acid--CoA ligase [Adhaeribacter radiodurans]
MFNLATFLQASAVHSGHKNAFTFGETTLTYAQVNGAANQVANGLRSLGLQTGDKVALSCFNLPYFPIIYYGILKAGAVVVPLNVLFKTDEIAYHLADSQAKAYFCFTGNAELPMAQMGHAAFINTPTCTHFFEITPNPADAPAIAGVKTFSNLISAQPTTLNIIPTAAEDTAVIVYTSGTTGKPKGAQLTHSSLAFNAILSADLFKLTAADRTIIVLPLFHIFAMTCLMNAGVYRAAHGILLPKFDAETVFGLLQKHEITLFVGVPTMYWALLHCTSKNFDYNKITQNMRLAVSGGAALPVRVLEDFQERFKVLILEGYGMSEGSPVVTFNQTEVGTKPGSIGTPVWGVEVKLVDQNGEEVPTGQKGELLFRGHNVMQGYYNRPAETDEVLRDGWMHSGDVAIKDEDGFYFIVDRTKDIIIRGGLNVYPREVEEIIMKHQAVSLTAVIGVPHEKLGEEIKAFIVLKEGKQATADEIREFAKNSMAAYKYPRAIEFVKSLPMTATGKILKKDLRTRLKVTS